MSKRIPVFGSVLILLMPMLLTLAHDIHACRMTRGLNVYDNDLLIRKLDASNTSLHDCSIDSRQSMSFLLSFQDKSAFQATATPEPINVLEDQAVALMTKANDLVSAGHYPEAIAEFEKVLPVIRKLEKYDYAKYRSY